jgi:transposase
VHTSVIQLPGAGRKRGRYSDEFKRQVVAACKQPGVSTGAVGLANGLNANLLRRWISESRLRARPAARQTKALAVATQTQFIPLQIQAGGVAPANIHIELQRAGTTVRVQWPLGYVPECAAWMHEVLK